MLACQPSSLINESALRSNCGAKMVASHSINKTRGGRDSPRTYQKLRQMCEKKAEKFVDDVHVSEIKATERGNLRGAKQSLAL
jgi:hypothetical protein